MFSSVVKSLGLLTLVTSASVSFADNALLTFECALQADPTTKAVVTTDGERFNGSVEDLVASVAIYKQGQLIQSATNAIIGERIPVRPDMVDANGQQTWAMNVSLGKSGRVAMGHVLDWGLKIQTLGLNMPNAEPAKCQILMNE